MPHPHPQGLHRLSATGVKHITAPGWHADGGGLYLEVDPSGRKRWAMRITVNGRRRDLGLGPIHKVSLQAARERAAEIRAKAYAGTEPVPRRRRSRLSDALPGDVVTFEQAANEAHRARKGVWSNGKHVDQWINTLRDYAYPVIGNLPVQAITTAEVLAVLTPIWGAKPETARRVRQRLKTVLEWARAKGHRSGDNPVDLIGDALPRHPQRTDHHAALPYTEVAGFIAALRTSASEPVTRVALEFLILTAARTKEVRHAEWAQIDLAAGLWTLPAASMKARREHTVPLPSRAVELLKQAKALLPADAATPFVFVEPRTGTPLSENRFLNARDAIGYGERCTPHGFRSSFRDWAAEETSFPPEVVEMALAHTIPNKAEAAYRRGDLLAKRRTLMEAWQDFVLPR